MRAVEDHHVDRPEVQARQRVQLTGTNRPNGLIRSGRRSRAFPARRCRPWKDDTPGTAHPAQSLEQAPAGACSRLCAGCAVPGVSSFQGLHRRAGKARLRLPDRIKPFGRLVPVS